MEDLTKTQFILLVLLVSFVTSLVTGVVTVTLVNQAPKPLTQTIQKVVERVSVAKDKDLENQISFITQEDLVVEIVKDASPAVVSIIATKDVPVIEEYFIDPFGSNDFVRELIPRDFFPELQVPQYKQRGTETRQISSGSGFFVSTDGYVATNRHVVEDSEAEYSVILNDGRKLKAEVLARDPFQDIAILKVEISDSPFLVIGNSNNLRVGQSVIAIGNALGEFQNTVSVGVISGLRRTIVATGAISGPEVLQEVIQTDAAINPGNSGGPLLNLEGHVIGLDVAMAQGAENVGFALPINLVKKDLEDVKEFGKVRYAFLGIRYVGINPQIKEEKGLSVDYGALIITGSEGESAVVAGSPADKAGIKEGDIILDFGGVRIDKENSLSKIIRGYQVGDKIVLKILREGKEFTVEVELAERTE